MSVHAYPSRLYISSLFYASPRTCTLDVRAGHDYEFLSFGAGPRRSFGLSHSLFAEAGDSLGDFLLRVPGAPHGGFWPLLGIFNATILSEPYLNELSPSFDFLCFQKISSSITHLRPLPSLPSLRTGTRCPPPEMTHWPTKISKTVSTGKTIQWLKKCLAASLQRMRKASLL